MKIKAIAMVIVLVMVLGLAPQVLAADNVLKVGIVAPLTGPSARVGEEFKGAVTIALEEIDYQVGDYKIKPVWIDSESETAKAAQGYSKAIMREGIDVGFLGWHSWVCVGLMDMASQYKIPHYFGYGATQVVNENYNRNPERYKYWLGKGWPLPQKLTKGYVEAIEGAIKAGKWDPKSKKAAIYGDNTDWGRDFGAGIAKQLKKSGWEIVTKEYFGKQESDFYPLLQSLKDQNVSLVAGTVGSVSAFSSFIKQLREINLNSMVVADGLGWTGEWYDLTGESSNYVVDQIPQWSTEESREFRDRFKKRYGFKPSPTSAAITYDLTNFFIKILKKTNQKYGELNSEVLAEFGEENLITGKISYKDGIVMEEYKYTPNTFPDPIVGPEHYMFPVIQYEDGEGSVIWPDAWSERKIEIPESIK
jgi:branched-chain amino acid transport system substrate-binding protein